MVNSHVPMNEKYLNETWAMDLLSCLAICSTLSKTVQVVGFLAQNS